MATTYIVMNLSEVFIFFIRTNLVSANIVQMAAFIELSIPEMLHQHAGSFRYQYTFYGRFGSLFTNIDEPIAKPAGADQLRLVDINGNVQNVIFDTEYDEWVPLTAELLHQIPETFTYAPKPISCEMELDYFVRSAGLIKHAFIWSGDAISRNDFAKIRSQSNAIYRGRYTLTPWLPQIGTLGVLDEIGIYAISEGDRAKMYGGDI